MVNVRKYMGGFVSGFILFLGSSSLFLVNQSANSSRMYHNQVSTTATKIINPYKFLRSTLDQLNYNIKKTHASFSENPKKLNQIVKSIILPNIAVNQLAGSVVGRKNWIHSTSAEKKEFINSFSELLTRSYSTALLKVSDYQILLRPIRGTSWKNMNMVRIASKIVSKSSGSSSNAAFYLERSGNTWKIYDLAIEGISIVKNFREQFASFSSLSSLTQKINKINKAAEES